VDPIIVAVVCVAVAVVVAVITWIVAVTYRKKVVESKIGGAEAQAREIIDEAVKTAEATKKEALLEVKEESLKTKNELERESKERRAELQRYEKRVLSKEEAIDKKAETLEKREAKMNAKEAELDRLSGEVEEAHQRQLQELEKISGLTSEQAKEYLIKSVEDEVKHETAVLIKELENNAKEEADKKAIEENVLRKINDEDGFYGLDENGDIIFLNDFANAESKARYNRVIEALNNGVVGYNLSE
jgi:ribonuclease Y